MRSGAFWLSVMPGALASILPASAAAATFHLRAGSELTVSAFGNSGMMASFGTPDASARWGYRQPATIMPAARRFVPSRLMDDSAIRGESYVGLFARRVHFQRFRLLGVNGSAPFPMAAFELGSRNRFFGDRLMINADVFRYRYGGYRLTLPVARGYSGVAGGLPSLGMSSRTMGAELQARYWLGSRDYAGVNASYTSGRRTTLPTLAMANTQITNVRSLQFGPAYEHILPLAHGRMLTFDAAATHRSSVRVANLPLGLLTNSLAIASFDSSVRKVETTRFDASLTYRSSPRLSATAFVRNITDVRPDRSTPLTTRNLVIPATASAVLSEPRTFGLALSVRL